MTPGEHPNKATIFDLGIWIVAGLIMWASIVTFIKGDGWLGFCLATGAMFVVASPALFAWSDGAGEATGQRGADQ